MRPLVVHFGPVQALDLRVGLVSVGDRPAVVIAGDGVALIVSQEQAEELRNSLSDVTFGWYEMERAGISLAVGSESLDGDGEQLDRIAEMTESISGVAGDGSRAYLVGECLSSACGVRSFVVRHDDSSPSVGERVGPHQPTEGGARKGHSDEQVLS